MNEACATCGQRCDKEACECLDSCINHEALSHIVAVGVACAKCGRPVLLLFEPTYSGEPIYCETCTTQEEAPQ